MKKPQRSSSTEQTTQFSTKFARTFRQWGRFTSSFSRRHPAASVDPIATVAAHAAQEEDLQDLEAEDPVLEQIRGNGATEGCSRDRSIDTITGS